MRKVGGNCEVSVIVPAYNEESCIEACLNSLLSQTHPSYEIIVVDDGSTDCTVDIVKSFQVTLLRQAHQGPARARNFGAEVAEGDILVFVDADMTFEPEFLQNLVRPIKEEKAIGTNTSEEYVADPSTVWARCWLTIFPSLEGLKEFPVYRAIRRSEFVRVGGFDSSGYPDDQSLSQKLGKKAIAAKGAICYHQCPTTLKDVYLEARWIGRSREPRNHLAAFLKASLPVSLLRGIIKSITHREPFLMIYRVVFDFGLFMGAIQRAFWPDRHYK